VSQIRAPAGLDIHAASPEEIAVSVLAEIIQVRGLRTKAKAEAKRTLPVVNKQAKDPVCGMEVDVVSAKYKSEHNGNSIYFCCAACKQTFDRQPEKYLATV
jgi:YHS domain-containing protein